MRDEPIAKDLVLIGGGHAHVHVLKSFGMHPMPGVRLTLIARDVETPYSGMLPGFIAGHYAREECHIDLAPLARFANAQLIHDEAIGLDIARRRIACRGGAEIAYDVTSIDIGSTPNLSAIPGAAEHAVPLKPIDSLAARWQRVIERVTESAAPVRFLMVGGGAAGVEVSLAMRHRLRGLLARIGRDPDAVGFSIITTGEILDSYPTLVRRWFRRLLADRGVALIEHATVTAVEPDAVLCADGRRVAYDELIWATEAGAAPWLASSGLQLDDRGFIKVDATLRSVSDPHVYAAGDVAANVDHPRPKAGVFAVRQGPPLADNLRRALAGDAPKAFRPQRNFLSLISTGNRYAIGSRGHFAMRGALLWRLKDWIDRRWMRSYQQLPNRGEALPVAPVGQSGSSPAQRHPAADR